MNIFMWVMIGLVAGWIIAQLIRHTTNNLIEIMFGLTGGFLGAFIANNLIGLTTSSVYTFLFAVLGAFIFVFLIRLRVINK